jgi:hypothetical protein
MKPLALAVAMLAVGDTPALRIAGREPLAATVQGVPARLLVDPGGPTMPVTNPDFAERAGFRSGWIGVAARIGPVTVPGKSAVIRFDVAGSAFKRRTAWFKAPVVADADAIVGPGGLPAQVVRFEMRAAMPGERIEALPLADFGARGMGVRIAAGEQEIEVRFSLARDRTVATASAGAAIAAASRGSFDRPAETMLIQLGVERPVRHLLLAEAFAVGPIALGQLMVRTGDFGSTAGIPDGDAAPADPDEIVVTGFKKQKQLRLEIGRDYLDRCSSIVIDKLRKRVTLACL